MEIPWGIIATVGIYVGAVFLITTWPGPPMGKAREGSLER